MCLAAVDVAPLGDDKALVVALGKGLDGAGGVALLAHELVAGEEEDAQAPLVVGVEEGREARVVGLCQAAVRGGVDDDDDLDDALCALLPRAGDAGGTTDLFAKLGKAHLALAGDVARAKVVKGLCRVCARLARRGAHGGGEGRGASACKEA